MLKRDYCKDIISRFSEDPILAETHKGVDHEVKTYLYDGIITNEDLRGKTKELFLDGHFAQAVEHAYKLIDNAVKQSVGSMCEARSGSKLMLQALSFENGPLRVNSNARGSDRDEQIGYMNILVGCMLGIRNPRVHDAELEDNEVDALRLIAFADYLLEKIDKAYIAKNE